MLRENKFQRKGRWPGSCQLLGRGEAKPAQMGVLALIRVPGGRQGSPGETRRCWADSSSPPTQPSSEVRCEKVKPPLMRLRLPDSHRAFQGPRAQLCT